MSHNLSTEANVGKIFLLIGFILGLITSIIMLLFGTGMTVLFASFGEGAELAIVGLIYLILGVIILIGTIIAIFAYKAASSRYMHKAGILGIIGSIVGGLNIFTLVGGILCLVSREAKHE